MCFSFLPSLLSLLSLTLYFLPASLSPAFLVCLSLSLFFLQLPTHLVLYACLLTNGDSRCSPRCLNTTDQAEPFKSPGISTLATPLAWSAFKSSCHQGNCKAGKYALVYLQTRTFAVKKNTLNTLHPLFHPDTYLFRRQCCHRSVCADPFDAVQTGPVADTEVTCTA